MLKEEPPNPWPQERLILHDRPPARSRRNAGWPPTRARASFGGNAGSIGYRGDLRAIAFQNRVSNRAR
jgi:hypothetical protein